MANSVDPDETDRTLFALVFVLAGMVKTIISCYHICYTYKDANCNNNILFLMFIDPIP